MALVLLMLISRFDSSLRSVFPLRAQNETDMLLYLLCYVLYRDANRIRVLLVERTTEKFEVGKSVYCIIALLSKVDYCLEYLEHLAVQAILPFTHIAFSHCKVCW